MDSCILRGRGGVTKSKSEWSAGNFHRESAEQPMLSKMDTNVLSSLCGRSIMGEQFSKMNSISSVSQYKCHKLSWTWASSSPILYSEVCKSKLAFKRSSRSRKALFTRTTTLGKTLLFHAKSAALWNYTFSNTYAPTVALFFSSCRKQISVWLQKTRHISICIFWFLKLHQNIIAHDFFFLPWTTERLQEG